MFKKFTLAACLAFCLLTAAIAFLGWRAKTEVEGVAVEQFNRQQLILAEKIARDIEEHFEFLDNCLKSLSGPWERASERGGRLDRIVDDFFDILKNSCVIGVGWADGLGGVRLFGEDEQPLAAELFSGGEALRLALAGREPGRTFTGRVFRPTRGPYAGRLIMVTAVSLATSPEAGALFLVTDPVAVARRYAHGLTSGETGYPWVIDGSGVFLDHFEEDFIGKPSLEARRERNPDIAWNRLAWLVTEKIMRGEKGVDWYVSGWHRGERGEIMKYAAYCPVRLSESGEPGVNWAVAVVAPLSEVHGVIGRLMTRQIAILALFEAVVVLFFAAALYIALRWSQSLRREVERKAGELLGAQEKLVRSERFAAIGQAAAHLSHEIKNPLALMGGFASQVRRKLPTGRDADKLKIIEEEAKRLETLLVEVRDFTRPNPPRMEDCDVNRLTAEILALMGEKLRSLSIEVRAVSSPEPLMVRCDPGQVKQVLLNLVKNAAEAMSGGGALTVSAERAEGGARLTVTDTGPGVPEEMAERIFEPFCTTKASGTGLGLSVCGRIVEDHGGALTCRSIPGKGAAFTIFLPYDGGGKEADQAG